MARIPEEEIRRLKEEVDLAALVAATGVELRPAGADLVGCCPFHDDRTPSLVVSVDKGLWHCLGACQVGGSVIDWVMKAEGVSFRHAVELLRSGVAPQVSGVRRATLRRLAAPVEADADDEAALAQVVAYYHETLSRSPVALSYLARRKIADPDALEHFSIGFSDRTLGLRLPHKQKKAGAELRGRLERLGIYRASGHEHLVGSITIPITDGGGHVTEIYGRKITRALKKGTALHLYLPGPHHGVFNEAGLLGGEVILCESLIDALTLYCCGFTNTTASYGTAGFTDDHRQAFGAHGVTRVLLAYDHDEAGDRAAQLLAHELMEEGIECFRVRLPVGADVNDVAVGAASPRDALGKLVREAAWMGKGAPPPGRSRRRAGPAPSPMAPSSSAAPSRSAALPSAPSSEPSAPSSEPPATPVPEAPTPPAAALAHDELTLEMGPRRWRVRHIPKSPTPGSLKVTVMVSSGERFHVDTLDLYSARARAGFCDAAATELRTERDELAGEVGRVLLATEDAQAAAQRSEPEVEEMSGAEREHAMALLCDPELLERVVEAFGVLGVVGEREAALVTWLTLISRLNDRPLGAVVQSSTAAGKSTLVDAALSLVPAEAKVAYSAMTGQALYYLGETDLAHKILALAEDEGASRAAYALKLLVSEGRLAIAAAGKDPVSGRLVTHTYEVEGPVALLMTTTAAELDDELANRLLVLSVDEGRAQTRAVQAAQREAETLQGLVARIKRADLTATFAAAQRLLSPVAVVNPFAPTLQFSDRATRHRRDNAKYLGLIRAIALAYQHQREKHQVVVDGRSVTYIEAQPSDLEAAEALCASVLAATTDELSPATRRLLEMTTAFVEQHHSATFTRRELREATGIGDTQMKVHLARLVDLEYVSARGAGPATTYELCTYDADGADQGSDRSGPSVDRSGPSVDRSGAGVDRSAIGRFSRRSAGGLFSQAEGHVASQAVESVGIGRVDLEEEAAPFTLADEENEAEEPDRSGRGRIRVLGEANRVAHVGGAP